MRLFGGTAIKLKVEKQIGKRIYKGFFAVLLATFLLTAILYTVFSRQFMVSETRKDLGKTGAIIEANLIKSIERAGSVEGARYARLISDIEAFDAFNKTETIVISDQQDVIYPIRGWDMTRLERVKKNLQSDEIRYIIYEYQVQNEKLPIETLVIMKRYEDVTALRNLGIRAFVISFAVGGLLAGMLGLLISRRIYKPITKLSDSMVAYTEHKKPVEIYPSHDEIEFLSRQFKTMTEKVSQLDIRQKQFFQNSSHELKTPLMSIQGYAEAIKDGIIKEDEMNQSLEIIIAETQRLKTIVDDVIYLSKIDNMTEEIHKQPEAIKALISEAAKVVSPLLKVNALTLTVQCDAEMLLDCDFEKMKRVMINLISNASRYAKSEITINVNQSGKRTFIDVIDDGDGLIPGQEEEIFDRFKKGASGGSGIGLALTKEIIEKHGGTIRAINNMKYGAIFKIEI